MSYRALLLVGALLWCRPGVAQTTPFKGVVWTVPPSTESALQDLADIRALGANAVLTDLIWNDRLLVAADSLGLMLFQDLPIEYLHARGLSDTLAATLLLLNDAIQRGTGHESARHFGLARRSDTSSPVSCEYFSRLTQFAHRTPGIRTYYRSYFARDDTCAQNVDAVLLETTAAHDPSQQLELWTSGTPVGIGSFGQLATRGAVGLSDPASAESQARFLETHLRQLLSSDTDVYALFVNRYRDARGDFRGGYGLIDASGRPRHAREVVRGFYSGEQDVFAFRSGQTPVDRGSWSLMAAWLAFAIFATTMSFSPRFSMLVIRSFTRQGYYVESLRNERGFLTGVAMISLVCQALLSGSMISLLVLTLQHEPLMSYLGALMPETARELYERSLAPGFLVLTGVFFLHVTSVFVIAVALKLVGRISLGEALTVIVWPAWITVLLPILVLLIPSLEPATASRLAIIALLCSGIPVLAALSTTAVHVFRLYLQSQGSRIAMGLFCVAMVSLLIWTALLLDWVPSRSTFAYLWHLALRG